MWGFIIACGPAKPPIFYGGEQIIKPPKEPRKIAVLPFYNQSTWDRAGEIFQNILTNQFLSSGFQILEPADIKKIYIFHAQKIPWEMSREVLRVFRDHFAVDWVLTGRMEAYGFIEQRDKKTPYISVGINLVDARQGNLILKTHLEKKGLDYSPAFEFGEIRTLDKLAAQIAQELIQNLSKE